MAINGLITFLSAVPAVFEQIPKFLPLKLFIAHRINATDMMDVFPDLIEPSHIRASYDVSGKARICACFLLIIFFCQAVFCKLFKGDRQGILIILFKI
jgi:hypothetical protein